MPSPSASLTGADGGSIKTQDHGVDLAEYGSGRVRAAVLRFIRDVTRG